MVIEIQRRQLIASVGAGSLTGIVVGTAKGNSESEEWVEIDTHKAGGDVIRTERVPDKWYVQLEKSRRVQEQLSNDMLNNTGVERVSRANSDDTINGFGKTEIVVEAKDPDHISDIEEIDGIPIRVEKTVELEDEYCEPSSPSCVPGGASVSRPFALNFTNCCPIEYQNDSRYLTTAHGFGDPCEDNIENTIYTTYPGGEDIGMVEMFDPVLDFAVIEPYQSTPGNNVIPEPNIPIWGYVTENGIDLLRSNNEQIEKYGSNTCHQLGEITSVSTLNQCGEAEQWIMGEFGNTGSGDSGGPHFHHIQDTQGEYISIVGVHKAGDGEMNTRASPAWRLADEYNIWFGTGSTC